MRRSPGSSWGSAASRSAAKRERPLDLVEPVVPLRAPAHVEQRAGVVLGGSGHPFDARLLEEQRQRQRALVERREDQRDVGPTGLHLGHESPEGSPVEPRRFERDPRDVDLEHLAHTGQQLCRRTTGRAAEERDRSVGRGHGPDRGPGHQHVTGSVEARDERPGSRRA